jgi:4-amino-4-deoxy-L-arabinose transferase-like glycosyltransferase
MDVGTDSRNIENGVRLDRPDALGGTYARWTEIALPAAGLLLLFWGLGGRSLWAAEGRWAQITREMFLTGDFFHPTIGGEPYFDKPLLTYWFRAGLYALTGTLNELIIRLPSAIAGLAAIWATVKVGTRLWSAQTGRIAGWLLLTTYSFLFWARTGTADAENLAVIILAVAWYWSRRDRLSFPAMLVFYLIAFVGGLTKGLTAVVVPVVIVLPDMVREGRWRILFSVRHIAAFGLALLVYLAPFVYASVTRPADYQSSGLALVFQENFLRYFRPIDHKGPIYLYVYSLPVLLLPWTPLFVLATIGVVKYRKGLDGNTRWLIWAIALVFLFFSISGSRRSYYILPILPLCALLMAVFVVWMREPGAEHMRQQGVDVQRLLLIGVAAFDVAIPLVLILAGRALHFRAPLEFYVVSLGIGTAGILLGVGLERFIQWPRPSPGGQRTIQPWIGVAAVLLGGYFCWQQNILEMNRTERPFAGKLRTMSAGLSPERIAIFPKANPNILFYLHMDEPIQIARDVDQLRRFLEPARPSAVIMQSRYAAALPDDLSRLLWSQPYLREQTEPWESKSSKQEKWVAWFWERLPDEPNATEVANGADHAE